MFDETLTLQIHTHDFIIFSPPGHTTGGDRSEKVTVCNSASNEGYPKVHKDFTITERAFTGAFAQLKVPNFTFTYHGVNIHLA